MIITKKYKLFENNYTPIICDKRQIILGNTFNDEMRHVIGWGLRNNGNYDKTAAFSIDAAGLVYEHFNPSYSSKYFNDKNLDTNAIIILIENYGWLNKDTEKNQFYNWVGDIYNKPLDVFEKRWRDFKYWAPYTSEQFDSAVKLVDKLCEDFNIPKTVVSHNTKIDLVNDYTGVLYKSNLDKNYTDLSPAWDFEGFKSKIEKK